MAKILNTDKNQMPVRMWSNGDSHSLLLGMQNSNSHFGTQFGSFPYKTEHTPTIQSAVTFFGNCPKEMKAYIHAKTCTRMFTAALFIITKIGKQPRCPSIGEWINKLWCLQTMEYYSALKRNELSSHEKTWRKLECILPNKRSQSEKATCCTIPLYDILEKAKLWR